MTLDQNGHPLKDRLLVEKFLQSIEGGGKFIFNKDDAIQVRINKISGKSGQVGIVPIVFVKIILFKNRKLHFLQIGHQAIQNFRPLMCGQIKMDWLPFLLSRFLFFLLLKFCFSVIEDAEGSLREKLLGLARSLFQCFLGLLIFSRWEDKGREALNNRKVQGPFSQNLLIRTGAKIILGWHLHHSISNLEINDASDSITGRIF